jgi:hypothetical protein
VTPDEREVLERAVRRMTEQASNADAIVDEAMAAGLDGSNPLTIHVKQLPAELLCIKAALERELEREVLECVGLRPDRPLRRRTRRPGPALGACRTGAALDAEAATLTAVQGTVLAGPGSHPRTRRRGPPPRARPAAYIAARPCHGEARGE